jgi:hypothetical protein
MGSLIMMHTNDYFDTGRIRKVWRYQSGNQKPCIEKGLEQ